jgi:hypothetical protein
MGLTPAFGRENPEVTVATPYNRRWGTRPRIMRIVSLTMTNDSTHPDLPGLPKGLPNTASEFVRPTWAYRPFKTSDSTPQVTTDELRRPAFSSDDSMLPVSTAEIPRPAWKKSA